jgi:hypothetical protein
MAQHSALFLGNLIQNGQLAGPAAAALAQVLAVPNWQDTIMFSTGNQQCFNRPGESSAPILVNPTATAPLVAPAKSMLTRTPEAVYTEMNQVMGAKGIYFPSGFPKGPWKKSEEAKDCINKCYAQKTSTGCGAFTAIFRSCMVARSASKGSKKGNRQLLVCDHHGGHISKSTGVRKGHCSKRTGCPWGIWIEESTEGWIPAFYNRASIAAALKEQAADAEAVHNHELIIKDSEKRSVATLRYFPEEILPYCDNLAGGRLKSAQIYERAKEKCADLDIEVNFTLRDFKNRYRVDPAEVDAAMDTTELFNYLKDKYAADSSRPFDQKIGTAGSIDDFFFALPAGV